MEQALTSLVNQLSDLSKDMLYSLVGEEESEDLPEERRLFAFFEEHCDAHHVLELDYNISSESWRVHYALGAISSQHQIGVQTVSFTF